MAQMMSQREFNYDKEKNFSEWYNTVIYAAELVDARYNVQGFVVHKPWSVKAFSKMYELFEKTPATKQMVILRRADHAHFMDNAEELHEGFRTMPSTGELARIQKEMQPITDLCSGEQAYLFVRGLTTCHMDAMLKGLGEARRFWIGDIKAELKNRGVATIFAHAGRRG